MGVTQFGNPEVLHIVHLAEPATGSGELRIRVQGAAVNPTDTGLRSGARAEMLKDIPAPYVPGMDVAGVLEQIGDGVSTDLRVGRRSPSATAFPAPRTLVFVKYLQSFSGWCK